MNYVASYPLSYGEFYKLQSPRAGPNVTTRKSSANEQK